MPTSTDITNFYSSNLEKFKPSGNQAMALCPYHKEDHPSLSINLQTGQFNCKNPTCAKTGNMITFAKAFNISYKSPQNGSGSPKTEPEAIYPYKNKNGEILFQEVRFSGKRIRFRKPDGAGGWVYKLGDVERPLYNLPQILNSNDVACFVVEGPKDADTLTNMGFLATTAPFGAGKWLPEYAKYLERFNVIIIPDNDEEGRFHANLVAQSLTKAQSTKIVTLPGLPPKGDVSDWFGEMKKGKAEFLFNCEQTPALEQRKTESKFGEIKKGDYLRNENVDIETHWLIKGIWPYHARGFVAGNPGVGKTWFTMGMALSVATGQPFLGEFEIPNPGKTLFIQEESSMINVIKRFRIITKSPDFPPETQSMLDQNFHVLVRQQVKILEDVNQILEVLKNNDFKMVIFDSLRRFHGANENSSTEMVPILDAFSEIQKQTEAAVVLIHHLHKSGDDKSGRSVFERLRGTSDFWAWRDAVIALEKDGEDDTKSKTSFQFRDAENTPPFITIREIMPEGGLALRKGNMEDSDRFQDVLEKIKKAMQKEGEPVFKTAILDPIKAKKQLKWRAFEWMINEKIVALDGKKWVLAKVFPKSREHAGTPGTD